MKRKLKIGDKVRVINYGALIWSRSEMRGLHLYKKDGDLYWYDICYQIVGEEGIVDGIINDGKRPQYSLTGIVGKHAWYDENQLERVGFNFIKWLIGIWRK